MSKKYISPSTAYEVIRKWKAQQEPEMFLKQRDSWEVWLQVLEYLIDD